MTVLFMHVQRTNGGVIMVNFYPDFINCTLDTVYGDDNRTASISQLAGQLRRQVTCADRSVVKTGQL